MKAGLAVAAMILAVASCASAKDAPSYDRGLLVSMDSSACGTSEKGSKTVAGEILGTDAQHKDVQQVLCQEYVLQGDRITYHIRPTDLKHPNLLPVGDTIQYRIKKDKMYVINREGDSKEREYSVISMRVRDDVIDPHVDAKNTQ